jgi:hypothetical protein
MIVTRCKGNALKFYKCEANFKAGARGTRKKKETVFGTKPAVLLTHESHYHVKGVEIFQIPLQKTVLVTEQPCTRRLNDIGAVYMLARICFLNYI